MKIESLHIGMRVKHPHYGVGVIKSIGEQTAEIEFNDGKRVIDPQISDVTPAGPMVANLEVPLGQVINETVDQVLARLGVEKPEAVIGELGARWFKGKMVLHPSDPLLQTKEVPLEVFFHKIVGMRNQLRVLEQKINGHPQLSDADKVEFQQYVTRCYGSMTTFNLLFKEKESQF
jgi:hypothetical protein